MEQSVLEGIVKHVSIVDDDAPDYDTFYIEAVKSKQVRDLIIAKTTEVITEDVLLKHCCYCGREL